MLLRKQFVLICMFFVIFCSCAKEKVFSKEFFLSSSRFDATTNFLSSYIENSDFSPNKDFYAEFSSVIYTNSTKSDMEQSEHNRNRLSVECRFYLKFTFKNDDNENDFLIHLFSSKEENVFLIFDDREKYVYEYEDADDYYYNKFSVLHDMSRIYC